MFEFDGTAWAPLTSTTQSPPPRFNAILVPDRAGGGMVLFAGTGLLDDMWRLGWESGDTADNCRDAQDLDGDGLAGCSDPDCYYVCAPLCTPGPRFHDVCRGHPALRRRDVQGIRRIVSRMPRGLRSVPGRVREHVLRCRRDGDELSRRLPLTY